MISIIIPTLNEEHCLAETLRSLRQHRPHQIIVVDGGSRDTTCQLAREADELVNSPRGRAVQMNRGAAHATGDILLFLHADCILEAGALTAVERALRRPRVAAG